MRKSRESRVFRHCCKECPPPFPALDVRKQGIDRPGCDVEHRRGRAACLVLVMRCPFGVVAVLTRGTIGGQPLGNRRTDAARSAGPQAISPFNISSPQVAALRPRRRPADLQRQHFRSRFLSIRRFNAVNCRAHLENTSRTRRDHGAHGRRPAQVSPAACHRCGSSGPCEILQST